jgi:hypothetical protein
MKKIENQFRTRFNEYTYASALVNEFRAAFDSTSHAWERSIGRDNIYTSSRDVENEKLKLDIRQTVKYYR